MNILTAHQPAYLPWLGFFHKISLSDIFVVLDDVQLEKNSFTNRNKIRGVNGDFWLTVPIKLKGHMHKKIREIEIDDGQNWQEKHLKAIENCYAKSPFFNDYIPFFRECYSRKWGTLIELTDYMLNWFLKQMKIEVVMYKMSDYSFRETKSDLVLEICRKFNADTYIFGALGRDYVEVDKFTAQGVTVYFQDYQHSVYQQQHGQFIPNLSVVDLLFNCGPDSLSILQKENVAKSGLLALQKERQ